MITAVGILTCYFFDSRFSIGSDSDTDGLFVSAIVRLPPVHERVVFPFGDGVTGKRFFSGVAFAIQIPRELGSLGILSTGFGRLDRVHNVTLHGRYDRHLDRLRRRAKI